MMMKLLKSVNGRILIEGHRGAEGLGVENTWESIEAGYNAGADILELDIQTTLDDELILYHNYKLPSGQWVRETTYDEIRFLKNKGKEIVKLADVLAWTNEKNVFLNLDIKNGFGFDNKIFLSTLNLVHKYRLSEKTIFSSWDHHALLLVKEHDPEISTLALLRGRPKNIVIMAKSAQVDAVNLDADMICREDIELLHKENIAVVSSETVYPDFNRSITLNVDVICCKDPSQAIDAVQNYKNSPSTYRPI